MHAIEIAAPGPPEALQLVTRPAPVPAAGRSTRRRRGRGRQPARPAPASGQLSAAARTSPTSPASRSPAASSGWGPRPPTDRRGRRSGRVWRTGDEVCALVAGGGYAETVAAPGVQCLPVPAGLSLVEAAALPETYFTVWTNVFERGRLAPGNGCSSMAARAALARPPSNWPRRVARASSPQPARPRSARCASGSGAARRSTTGPRTSSRPSSRAHRRAAAWTSSSTWSAARTRRATSTAWRATAGSSRSASWAAPTTTSRSSRSCCGA